MPTDEDREAFLARLTPAERDEAQAVAAAARRAEEQQSAAGGNNHGLLRHDQPAMAATINKEERLVFVPKRMREQLQKQQQQRTNNGGSNTTIGHKPKESVTSTKNGASRPVKKPDPLQAASTLSEKERIAVRETYLGKSAIEPDEDEQAAKRKKQKSNKKITFKFRWDNTDDTFNDDDPLYASMLPASRATVSLQKKTDKLQKLVGTSEVSSLQSVMRKPLEKMTARDWRIVRENYEVTVKGGKAPPPLRSFQESPSRELPPLHPALLDAIENVLRFREPSPIQRQAIPVGLQRRDLIGIAETGTWFRSPLLMFGCLYSLRISSYAIVSLVRSNSSDRQWKDRCVWCAPVSLSAQSSSPSARQRCRRRPSGPRHGAHARTRPTD